MARHPRIYLRGKLFNLPHPFEEEVEWLVRTNHRLLLERIAAIEKEETATLYKNHTVSEELGAEIQYTKSLAAELRRSANSLALVSLVTRFQHWVRLCVAELVNKDAANTGLMTNLKALRQRLGEGPVPITFFENLETVRDSVIHADSNAEWMRGKTLRSVPKHYRDENLDEVDFREAHFQEAIENSIKQVKWYDERLDALNRTGETE